MTEEEEIKKEKEVRTKALKSMATGLVILANCIGGKRDLTVTPKSFVDDCEAVAGEFIDRVDLEVLDAFLE